MNSSVSCKLGLTETKFLFLDKLPQVSMWSDDLSKLINLKFSKYVFVLIYGKFRMKSLG